MIPTGTPGKRNKKTSRLALFFTEKQAARLSDLSPSTIRSWQQQGIIHLADRPDGSRGPHSRLYSYFSVVTLRLLSKLRKQWNVPLTEIRKTANYLRSLGADPWHRKVYVVDRQVLFEHPDTGDLSRHTGQHALLDLSVIEQETRREIKSLLRRPAETVGKLTRQRNVLGNALTIEGTRVRTSSVWNLYKAGYSTDEIIAEYPDLTAEDVRVALAREGSLHTQAA